MVGSGTRRLLVNAWVRSLQEFRENGLVPWSADDASRLIEGARSQLDALEVHEVGLEGE